MEQKIFIKVHRSYRSVVAVCDSELVGKKFEEGKRQLDVRDNFYRGEELDEDKALEVIQMQRREDATFNIVGERSIKIAIDAEIIGEGNVGEVDGVPFALVLL